MAHFGSIVLINWCSLYDLVLMLDNFNKLQV